MRSIPVLFDDFLGDREDQLALEGNPYTDDGLDGLIPNSEASSDGVSNCGDSSIDEEDTLVCLELGRFAEDPSLRKLEKYFLLFGGGVGATSYVLSENSLVLFCSSEVVELR